MAHLALMLVRIDDATHPDQFTELRRVDLPPVVAAELPPERALDELEARTLAAGQEVMRQTLMEQWTTAEAQLVAEYQALSPPG